MAVTYCTTKKAFEFLGAFKRIPIANNGTPELVGTGDNVATTYYLANRNVIAGTYTLYHASSWSSSATALTETTHYTLNKDDGIITLTASGVTALGTNKLYARYWHTGGALSNTSMETYINQAEDMIDYETGHAWRAVTVTNEFHNISEPYKTYQGIRVELNHRSIRSMTNGTDKIEIWDGSSYTDWVATKTEGRANDFWLDYVLGRLFLITTTNRPMGVRLTYRYGESSIPTDIERATILLACWMALQGDDRTVLLPEGSSNIPLPNKASLWKDEASRIMRNHKEFLVPTC